VPAAVLFNVMAGITHWAALVDLSVRNGPFHYLVHTLFVLASLLIWTPVCGPFPQLHLSPPGKMIYIFLMSIIPTFPAAFLTASDGVIYRSYDHGPRLWFQRVVEDQQFAGVVMKVIEGLYLWILILVLFLKWMEGSAPKGRFRGTLVPSEPAASGVPAEDAGRDGGQDDAPHHEDGPGAGVHVLATGEGPDHHVRERGGGEELRDTP
jgi:putative membrane protein